MQNIKVLKPGVRISNRIRNQPEPHPVALMAAGLCPLPNDQDMIRKSACEAGISQMAHLIRKARSPEINPASLMAGQFP